MTSRFPAEALRLSSPSADKLKNMLVLLDNWERHTKGQRGFLSQSTATGLRVTVSSVLSLLKYLCEVVGFKYLLTSRTSQDPIEHLFGIVRQSCGCNAHPTPQQFVVAVNCLSFSNLVHSVAKGNCEPAILSSLLGPDASQHSGPSGKQQLVDMCLDVGNIDAADTLMLSAESDHTSCAVASSDSRLIFYMAGYVARKCILRTKCEECLNLLLISKEKSEVLNLAQFTLLKDNGGLLYPASVLYQFVADLENAFTACFSLNELHSDSILDVLSTLTAKRNYSLGCADHCQNVAAEMTAFYVTTRMHFFTKSINQSNDKRRQASKHLKLSRCS